MMIHPLAMISSVTPLGFFKYQQCYHVAMSDSIGKIHRHLDNEIGHIFFPKKNFSK
jgi:hypothetical protein